MTIPGLKKLRSLNYSLLIPLLLFSFFIIPFFNLPACWDASTELRKTGTFDQGIQKSMLAYMKNGSLHPPFKFFLSSIFYTIGGKSIVTYHEMGLAIGYLAIIALYLLCKNIFNKNVALIASVLLATFPLFVANSADNYTDFFVAVFSVVSLYFYSKNNLPLYVVAGSFTALSKDTGLLLPLSVLLIEFYACFIRKRASISSAVRILILAFPLFSYLAWYLYIRMNGFGAYHEYIFADTSERGAIATILYNFFTLNFFHSYAKAHFLQLLFLNFTWVYWLTIIIGLIGVVKKKKFLRITVTLQKTSQSLKGLFSMGLFFILFGFISVILQILIIPQERLSSINFHWVLWPILLLGFIALTKNIHLNYKNPSLVLDEQKTKTIFAMFVFFLLYVLTIVTFQVWNTPRYNLPLIPILVVAASFFISRFITKLPLFLFLFFCSLNFLGLFFSIDPISILLWGRGTASGQSMYVISKSVMVDDGLVYNLQYLLAMKKRQELDSSRICALNN